MPGRILVAILALVVVMAVSACGGGVVAPPSGGPNGTTARAATAQPTATPPAHQAGEALFTRHCLSCHGVAAAGTTMGPPLVDPLYTPDKVADDAFTKAALFGALKRQWDFGDMPPVAGITDPDVRQITGYIRYLQRQAGIE